MLLRRSNPTGFTIVELVIVMVIIGAVSAIAIPRFADAGSGRRLAAASRTLIADIEHIKLVARSSSKTHIIKFYPADEMYVIVKGTEVNRNSIVLVRVLSDSPFAAGINRTSLGANQFAVINPLGELSPGFTVGLLVNGVEKSVVVDGGASSPVSVTDTITTVEILSQRK